jgi:hypothetical protein
VDALMLSSEFSQELAAMIRSMQDRIRLEPDLKDTDEGYDPRDDLDRAIIRLIALRLSLY